MVIVNIQCLVLSPSDSIALHPDYHLIDVLFTAFDFDFVFFVISDFDRMYVFDSLFVANIFHIDFDWVFL